ncbi:BBT_HP_G0054500.mRNA.1.CDS.1 [Saccharomyces cerevisiae]|nr:BBT_HP_G0054500.mRNA.1.CDS.1 [Saccharomyces cerevisiae]CAI6702832.1 BBT_HP_G0054500.mRNA.1.CDS.1 [Saccharomyces cerevisiae]
MTYVFAVMGEYWRWSIHWIFFSFLEDKAPYQRLQDAIFLCFMMLCEHSIISEKDLATIIGPFFLSCTLIVRYLKNISTLFFLYFYFCCGFKTSAMLVSFYLDALLFFHVLFVIWVVKASIFLVTATAVFVAFLYSFTASFCGVV